MGRLVTLATIALLITGATESGRKAVAHGGGDVEIIDTKKYAKEGIAREDVGKRALLDLAAAQYASKAEVITEDQLRRLLVAEGRTTAEAELHAKAFDPSKGLLNVVLKPGTIVGRYYGGGRSGPRRSSLFLSHARGVWVFLPGSTANADGLALPQANVARFLATLATLHDTPGVMGYVAPNYGKLGGEIQVRLLVPPDDALKLLRVIQISDIVPSSTTCLASTASAVLCMSRRVQEVPAVSNDLRVHIYGYETSRRTLEREYWSIVLWFVTAPH